METRKIHDINGTWWINTAQFPFVDPTSNCRFDPQTPTQTKETAWMKGQPMIKPFVDPNEKPKVGEVVEKPKAAAK